MQRERVWPLCQRRFCDCDCVRGDARGVAVLGLEGVLDGSAVAARGIVDEFDVLGVQFARL